MKVLLTTKNYYTGEVIDEEWYDNKHDAVRAARDYEKNPTAKCLIEVMDDDCAWLEVIENV